MLASHPGAFTAHRPRKRSVAEVLLVVLALVAIATRITEIPTHPLAFVRVALSLAAVAFLLFGPGASFGKRAVAIIALEAALGFLTFALVDAPFIMEHQRQIGMLAVGLAEKVDRAERSREIGVR